jgi:hypothetical protein
VSAKECTPSESIAELPVKNPATNFEQAISRFAAMATPIALGVFVIFSIAARTNGYDSAEVRWLSMKRFLYSAEKNPVLAIL